MKFDLLGIRNAYLSWKACQQAVADLRGQAGRKHPKKLERKLTDVENRERRAFFGFITRSAIAAGVVLVPGAAYLIGKTDNHPVTSPTTKRPASLSDAEQINALTHFFSIRQSQMKNDIEPGNLDAATWAVVAFRDGWRIEDLDMIERVAAEKLASFPLVDPALRFVVSEIDYRPFIASLLPQSLSEKTKIALVINYKVLPLSEAEWRDMFDHELNHALLGKTDVITDKAYLGNSLNRRQYFINYYNLANLFMAGGEREEFERLVQTFVSLYAEEGYPFADAMSDIGSMLISEIFADILINPLGETTRARYRKVINHLIATNDTVGTIYVGRIETIARLLGVTLNIAEAERKMLGNPSLREIAAGLSEILFGLRDRLIGHFVFDPSKGLYTINA